VEKFGVKVTEVQVRAKKYASRLPEVELPNDVPTTEDLLRNQQSDYREIKVGMTPGTAELGGPGGLGGSKN
jgi:hypothetical protein